MSLRVVLSLVIAGITIAALSSMKMLFKLDYFTHSVGVELSVVMTTGLLVVRFFIDFAGPWHTNSFMLTTVLVINILNYNMVHYTLGRMQLSGQRVNDYYQVWGVLMVTLQYSVKIGRPYGRSEIPLLDLMSSLWAGNLLRVQTVYSLKIPLWLIWSVNATRIVAYFLFSDRSVTRSEENARIVCDYMRYEHTLSETTNTESMSGYKYLVFGEHQQKMKHDPGEFTLRLDENHKNLVTVEKIWELRESKLLGRTADPDDKLKDVCLSFALYKLLRRRLYDLPIHEAEQDKTKKLVFEGILKGRNDEYERVFRITGVELSFLQDSLHSKHAKMLANGFPFTTLLLSLILVAATGYIIYPVLHIPRMIDSKDSSRIVHGVFISCCIVGLIIAKEIAEIMMYVFSRWTMVLMICMHVKYPRFGCSWLIEKAMGCMFRLIRKGNWEQKIHQYNLLISSHPQKKAWFAFFPTKINLDTEAKNAIFDSFRSLDKNLPRLETYFLDAFRSDKERMHQLEWAIDMEADTHRILVWHIATCLCEFHLSDDHVKARMTLTLKSTPLIEKSRDIENVWKHYITASSLSNYCAYLLLKKLVPDNGLVVDKVLSAVIGETNFAVRPFSYLSSLKNTYSSIMRKERAEGNEKADKQEPDQAPVTTVLGVGNSETATAKQDPENGRKGYDHYEDSIIMMGARLGKQLVGMYETDIGLWRDLAMFWTGFLLHLAANTGAAKHKMNFSRNGELITHLWALMSHAGILGSSHGEQLLDPVNLAENNEVDRNMTDTSAQTTFH